MERVLGVILTGGGGLAVLASFVYALNEWRYWPVALAVVGSPGLAAVGLGICLMASRRPSVVSVGAALCCVAVVLPTWFVIEAGPEAWLVCSITWAAALASSLLALYSRRRARVDGSL